MMIYDCFYVTLATLLDPENYFQEFKDAKKILQYLKDAYPELEEDTWKEYILASYELHHGHLSIQGRLHYIKGVIFCENYPEPIEDVLIEQRKRILEYRSINGKPSRHVKLAITEFTYQQFIEQLEEDSKLLLFTLPASSIPQ